MSRLTVGSIEGLAENSNVISVPTGHTLNAVDGLQIGGTAVGEWIDYSASQTFVSGFTKGNATVESYYTRVGDVVFMRGWVTLGSTSSITGTLDIGVPIAGADTSLKFWGGKSHFRTPNTIGGILCVNSTTFRLIVYTASSTYVGSVDVSPTVPFTWTTGSEFGWDFYYRAA